MAARTFALSALAALSIASGANAYYQYSMTQAGFSPTWSQFTQHYVGPSGFALSYGLTTGGNPTEHRAFETTCPAPIPTQDYSASYCSLLFTSGYDLGTQGAIPQLTYREDFRSDFGVQMSGPVVRQAGNFYFAPVLSVSAANWTSSNLLTLTAADFYLLTYNPMQPFGLDPSSNPDFSAAGGVIEFGMFRGVSSGPVPGGGSDNATAYTDNVYITIPAPASALLVLAALPRRACRRR